jgi:hypothetical protein
MKSMLVTTTNMHFVTTQTSEDIEEFVTVFRQKKSYYVTNAKRNLKILAFIRESALLLTFGYLEFSTNSRES